MKEAQKEEEPQEQQQLSVCCVFRCKMSRRKGVPIEEVKRVLDESDSDDDIDFGSCDESSEYEEGVGDETEDMHYKPDSESDSGSVCDSDSSLDQPCNSGKRARHDNILNQAHIFESRSGRKWTTKDPHSTQTAAHNVLRQTRGLVGDAKNVSDKCGALKLLITPDMVNLIVRETNRRAKQVIAKWNTSHPATQKTWTETDETEIYACIGILLLGGVYKSANESVGEMWSMDSGRPVFRATMSMERFHHLLRFCRFDNEATREQRLETDKLAACSDFWKMFLDNLAKFYKPGSDLTVDEQLVAFRGRCKIKQYIPIKPGKYGIKIYWCCDAENSYPLTAEVYVGRQPGAAVGRNSTVDLVKRLVDPWKNKGRNVTMDNFFTSAELAEDLLKVKTTVVGTMRHNRKEVPRELLKDRQREEKSSIFCFDRELTLVSYVPKKGKAVVLLSSMHHDKAINEENDKKPRLLFITMKQNPV